MSNHGLNPIETLRLSAADKQKLIDYVEHQAKRPAGNDERRGLRVNYFGRKVLVTITSKEGQKTCCTVVPRNLSRKGLAFVHGRFIYPDSRCEATIPMLNGKWCVLKGVIRRCRHVQGIVHEVSVVFDETIDLNQFIRLTSEQSERHLAEMTEDGLNDDDLQPGCRGKVLVVDDLPADRRLFKLWLQRMQLAVEEAGDVQETLEMITHDTFDIFIIDGQLGEEDGVELIEHLRGQGVIAPIVSISAHADHDGFIDRANRAGATAVLAKPFDPDELRKHVEAALSLEQESDDRPLVSQLAGDAEMEPLIADFVSSLAVYVAKVRSAMADSDFNQLVKLCNNLKGAGGSHGFPKLTDSARIASELLDAKPRDADKVRRSINDLLSVIRRIQAAYG